MKRRSTILALALVLTLSAVAAWAYWSQFGAGAAAATTASLDAATITAPGSGINSVTVTWSTQSSLNPTSAANSSITYSVERKLGAGGWAAIASGGCSGAKPRGTTSCVDTPAAAGSYSYRAVANFHTWTATSNEVGPVTVTIDTTPPTVSSIVRLGSTPTNASSLQWTVTFSETVTGVGTADFALATTGSVSGASISSVSGSGTTYTVSATSGSGEGTLGLNLVDDDTIADVAANKLGGTGNGNGNLTGQTYALDANAPAATSIVRANADPTNAGSLQWTVTFSEPVTGVNSGDFTLPTTGSVSGASISSVSGSGSGTTYTVSATTGSGDGTLGLNLVDDDTIIDAATNKLGDTGLGNGNLTGQTYTLDKTAPAATSIVRANANPTNASSVQWTVTISETVTGVGSGDFALAAAGISGASISSVSGSGTTYTVTATTGSGTGTLGLNLVDDDTIADTATNKLGGTGNGNGNLTGQTYTLDLTAPTVSTIVRADTSPTNASSAHWTVTFSETVTGVGSGDFALAATGITGAAITSVTGSGATYTVTATTGSGDGTLGLNLVDDDTITDTLTNKLGGTGTGNGNLTGQTYTLDLTAPTVSSIVRATSTPTNAASVQWTVTLSESVTGVGIGDFTLANTGLTTPSITSVTGSGASYTVTASTGTGDGTLGLNLVDDDTVIDALTNKLGGAGTGNGNFTGQTYTIDKTPPTAPLSASVTNGVSPSSLTCGIASSTRFINNAGKSSVGINATFTAAPNTGDAMVFSISTPGSTPVTATVTSAPPSTSVSTTLDLSSDVFLDGTITLSVRTRDLAGNLSTASTSPLTIIVKDTVALLTANYSPTGGGALNLSPRVYGTAECGAFISAQKTTGGSPDTTTITSGSNYEIVVGLLALGSASYDVTSTDLVGNTHTAIRVP